MPWSDLIDQRRVTETLQRAVAGGRVAHAYLFYGPDGVGKRAVALELARTLQCEHGGDTACGTCSACTKVSRMMHPDVHVLLPYPSDADPSDVAERLQRIDRSPQDYEQGLQQFLSQSPWDERPVRDQLAHVGPEDWLTGDVFGTTDEAFNALT